MIPMFAMAELNFDGDVRRIDFCQLYCISINSIFDYMIVTPIQFLSKWGKLEI